MGYVRISDIVRTKTKGNIKHFSYNWSLRQNKKKLGIRFWFKVPDEKVRLTNERHKVKYVPTQNFKLVEPRNIVYTKDIFDLYLTIFQMNLAEVEN